MTSSWKWTAAWTLLVATSGCVTADPASELRTVSSPSTSFDAEAVAPVLDPALLDSVEPPPATDERGADLARFCKEVTETLASVDSVECLELGLEETGAYSVEGRPILAREYEPVDGVAPRGRVLVIGGIHGDEYSAVSVTFKWMWILSEFHSGLFHWKIAPLVNPDGLLGARARRTNANGVDLNRNFPTPDWQAESWAHWVASTGRSERRFPGSLAASEPETAWLVEEIDLFEPDVIVSVHAPAHVVDFDGPPEGPQKLGSLRLHLLGTFPGSLGRYAGVHMGIPVVTIELPNAGILPTRDAYTAIWVDLVAWLKTRLPAARSAPGLETALLGPTPWPSAEVTEADEEHSPGSASDQDPPS